MCLYLKGLEIQVFKSFPDKTVLTFGEDLTAIVGPNGSGKSNISDAIRWVMGEQSTKALRGGKMEDVIFGGTQKRKEQGFAEVSLILDNEGHLLPMEESEVMITRRYYRSGESEYYINRRTVRLKDVNELFMDTGLGRDGYAIIGQGRIDEILSVKSGDRREVFEEAAGISRYRHRKEEATRKLDRTQENLVRIGDKIEELELQVEPLRNQAEKAKKFLILRDQLRGLEIALWLSQLEGIRVALRKTQSDLERALAERDATQGEVEALYSKVESLTEEMKSKDLEAEGVRFEMMRREADGNEISRAMAVLQTNVENNKENAGRVEEELSQQEERTQGLAAQMEERQQRLATIGEELAALRITLAEAEHQAEEASATVGTLTGELEELRQKESLSATSAAEAKALLSALAAASQEVLDQEERIGGELALTMERMQEGEATLKSAKASLNEAVEGKNALQNTIDGYTLRLENRRKKAEEAREIVKKGEMEHHALTSRIHMLGEMEKMYEGYSKAVKLVMTDGERGQLKGICGPVASLIKVPDQYAVAIEIALGGAMQNIVVEDENAGKNAIQSLKRRDGGRATFLPLTTMKAAYFKDKEVEKEKGFVGMADSLLTCDKRYSHVFSHLLGRTVIAETMDSAIAMAKTYRYGFRIVTLDGQVLQSGGSMTGGSTSRSGGILSRANELERLNAQKVGMEEKFNQWKSELADRERALTATTYELETAQSQQRTHQDAILQWEERVNHLAGEQQRLETTKQQQQQERQEFQNRAAVLEEDTAKARAHITQLEGEAVALRTLAESKVEGQTTLQEERQALTQRVAQIQVELATLEGEEQSGVQALAQLKALYESMAQDTVSRATMVEEFRSKNTALLAEISQKEGALLAIQQENIGRQEQISKIQGEKLTLEGARTSAERESRDKNNQLMSMGGEVSRLEQKKNSSAMEEKQILDKLWDTYELSHEGALRQRQEIESIPQAIKEIAQLKRSISALGNINLDAIEEFERVFERYSYLVSQRDDVSKAKEELEAIIAQMTGEMKEIFAREFVRINEAFQKTFLELFGGGKANLELEDPDDILNCGIEIKVQPPGKALKIISLLSGGEKAFVAIALYFAILQIRPTPFCVMDEIEAALDDANVTRFARYIRTLSEKTQFIVITHRRGTMEEADVLYGVTMQEQGVSRMLSINLNQIESELKL